MEPRPWPEQGATETEKALLRAGRAEAPAEGADRRILALLQTVSPAPVKTPTVGRWAKVGVIAVVAGGAAIVSHQVFRPRALPPSDIPVPSMIPEAVAPVAPPTEGQPLPETPPPPTASEDLAAPRPNARPPRARTRSVSAPSSEASLPARPAASALDHSLGEEIKVLDRAREALAASRPLDVLRLVDEHHRKFPQGRLRPEAMILRLAALLQAGRREAADALARQLLSDDAYVPYVPRIQSLLREAKP